MGWLVIVLWNYLFQKIKPSHWLFWWTQYRISISSTAALAKIGLHASSIYLSIFGFQSQLSSAGGFHVPSFCIYFYSLWGLHHQRPGWGLQSETHVSHRLKTLRGSQCSWHGNSISVFDQGICLACVLPFWSSYDRVYSRLDLHYLLRGQTEGVLQPWLYFILYLVICFFGLINQTLAYTVSYRVGQPEV